MEHIKKTSRKQVGKKLRAQFITGILIIVPIGAAILILRWLFFSIDNILQPVAELLLGYTIPGLGLGITIVLIYLAGVVATNVI